MSHKRIYVIDDDEIFQFMIKKNLKLIDKNIKIESFPDGEKAVTALSQKFADSEKFPDIIFLDINMPVMDGWEFLESYKNIKSNFPKDVVIYIISSSKNLEDLIKAKEFTDLSGYIVKPITNSQLKKVVQGVPKDNWLISSE